MENIYSLLDKLAEEIKGSKKAMFSNSRIIDEIRCMELIDAMIHIMPTALKEAQYIVRDKEQILSDAAAQAKKMLEKAERQVSEMLSESALIKQAKQESDILMDNAEHYAAVIESETKKRIDRLFAESEEQLTEVLQAIRESREDLIGSMIRKGQYED